MSTISFSVDEQIKKDIARWAKAAKKSKSELFRDMATVYMFNKKWERFADMTDKVLDNLGIETEEELHEYLESDDTYEDRLRHQHLSGSQQKKQSLV